MLFAGRLIDELLLATCNPGDRRSLECEADELIGRFVSPVSPDALAAAASALDQEADSDRAGRTRLKLWAATLRQRARAL